MEKLNSIISDIQSNLAIEMSITSAKRFYGASTIFKGYIENIYKHILICICIFCLKIHTYMIVIFNNVWHRD